MAPTRFLARRGNRFRVVPASDVVAFTFVDGVTHLLTATEQLSMQPTLASLARRLDARQLLPGVAQRDHPAGCGAGSEAVQPTAPARSCWRTGRRSWWRAGAGGALLDKLIAESLSFGDTSAKRPGFSGPS